MYLELERQEILDAATQGRDNGRPWFATIISDAITTDDQVLVRIPSIDDGQFAWGPVRWTPQVVFKEDGVWLALPKSGEECLVQYDDDGNLWLLQWETV
jgi:hypothetical protein